MTLSLFRPSLLSVFLLAFTVLISAAFADRFGRDQEGDLFEHENANTEFVYRIRYEKLRTNLSSFCDPPTTCFIYCEYFN